MSTLSVSEPSRWARLRADGLEEAWLGEALGPTVRVVTDEAALLAHLGERVLIRFARRTDEMIAAEQADRAEQVASLPAAARRVLRAAQRHAVDGEVVGLHTWDPVEDAPSVRALHGAGLMRIRGPREEPYLGRYRLDADLPPLPAHGYDMEEAVMEEVDDLSEARPGLIGLMHDMAALAAAILQAPPRRTHAGALAKADARKLGRRLGVSALAQHGDLSRLPRWGQALRALEALGAVGVDPLSRTLGVDLGLETALAGETPEAIDRLVHRLVDRDQHVLLPAIRAALQQAGPGCVDTVVFCDLLREQHRDVLFPPWRRDGATVYPHLDAEAVVAYTDDSFDMVEAPMVHRLLKRLDKLGLVRRAEGVFGATADGRIWSGALQPPAARLWVGSDLELIVPPEAVTPWERFQLERMSRCLARDVVNRYALDREGLSAWLAGHELEEALALLRRRSPGVPTVVIETLHGWASAAMQVVLTHGVLLPAPEPAILSP